VRVILVLLGLLGCWCLRLLGGLQIEWCRLKERGRVVIKKQWGCLKAPKVTNNSWMAWIILGLNTGHGDVERLLAPEKEWIEHHWRLLLEVIHTQQILQQRWVINSSHYILQEHLVLSRS